MTVYVLKPKGGADFYVLWSTNTDSPVGWGDRAFLKAEWPNHDLGRWDPTRFDRADVEGTSAPPHGAWMDRGLVYEQRGWLPRRNLRALCDRLDYSEDVGDLLMPFDDVAPELLVRPAAEQYRIT